MGRILVGTTSWTEKTLIEEGRFYPPDVKTSEDRLRYYAKQFPVTEVDSSYYGLLSEHNAELWAERSPRGFVFDVKAFRLFTQHRTPVRSLPKDLRGPFEGQDDVYLKDVPADVRDELWHRFRSALEPLRASGKLGVVLLQLAPWFTYGPPHLDYIAECASRLEGIRVAVELRNKSWLNERHASKVLEFERAHGLVNVVVDEPQGFPSSVPPVWAVTQREVAVVRLHGRNRATWDQKDLPSAAARFGYLYPDHELRDFVSPIRGLAHQAKEVHVLFNNCHRDNAQRNAATLRRMMHV